MIRIYQLGEVAVHLHQQMWHGYDLAARGKETELQWSSTTVWPDSQFIYKTRKIKIKSVLISEGGYTDKNQLELLNGLIGLPVPIIAYQDMGCCGTASCACEHRGSCELIWLINHGVLASIKADENKDAIGFITVELEIEFGGFWQPLDRYLWTWQGSEYDHFCPPASNPYPYFSYMTPYPDCQSVMENCCSLKWSKRPVTDCVLAYDPELWVSNLADSDVRTPYMVAQYWGGKNHDIFSATHLFGAPPLSIYGFRGITSGGSITITVKRLKGPYTAVEEDTVINLTATNVKLASKGLATLSANDLIYVGDTHLKPGFIVRDGAIIDDVWPTTTYSGLWPGMASPGRNQVRFDLPDGCQTAYVHWLRKI